MTKEDIKSEVSHETQRDTWWDDFKSALNKAQKETENRIPTEHAQALQIITERITSGEIMEARTLIAKEIERNNRLMEDCQQREEDLKRILQALEGK